MARGSAEQQEYEERGAGMALAQASRITVQRLYHEHLLSEVVANKLIDAYEASEREYETSANELIAKSPELTMFSLQSADIEIAQAQKQALLPLLRRGVISEEVYSEWVNRIDQHLQKNPTGDIVLPALAEAMNDE